MLKLEKKIKDNVNRILKQKKIKLTKVIRDRFVKKYKNNCEKVDFGNKFYNRTSEVGNKILDVKELKVEKTIYKDIKLEHEKHCDILWYSKFNVTEEELKLMYKKHVSTCAHAINIIEHRYNNFYNITVIRNRVTIGTEVREIWYKSFRDRIKNEKLKLERNIKSENFLKRIYRPYDAKLDFDRNKIKVNFKKKYNLTNRTNFYINYLNKHKFNLKETTFNTLHEISLVIPIYYTCNCFIKKNRSFHCLFKRYKKLYYLKEKTNKYYMLSEADAAHKHYMNHIHEIYNLFTEKTSFQRAGKVLDFEKIARTSALKGNYHQGDRKLDILSLQEVKKIKIEKREKYRKRRLEILFELSVLNSAYSKRKLKFSKITRNLEKLEQLLLHVKELNAFLDRTTINIHP